MTAPVRPGKIAHSARTIVFSLLAMLAVLVTPLFTALPVYADWGPDVQLSTDPASCRPFLTVSGNSVHVVWAESVGGDCEIFYKRSVTGGVTWGPEVRLTSSTGYSNNPVIAASGNNIHVAWYDDRDGNYEIYYKQSTDGGTTWDADTRLTNSGGTSENPSIAVSGSSVHVAWYDRRDGNDEIYYKHSIDGGVTWCADTRLTNDPAYSVYPSIAVSDNNVHITWQDERGGNAQVYYIRSADGGATWGTGTSITAGPAIAWEPSIAVSGTNIHVAWYDNRDTAEIYYKHSTDGGVTWGLETRLTNATDYSWHPFVAVSGNNVHVAWDDYRNASSGEIYYKLSTDNGATWGNDIRLTNAPGNSGEPSIAVAGNNIFVAWIDGREGGYKEYFKKYSAIPVITSINPLSGKSGTRVIIHGANFTGAVEVKFGGIPAASFTVHSDNQITAIVANGATGKITVTTYSGTATTAGDFIFIAPDNLIRTAPRGSSMSSVTAAPNQSSVSLPTVSIKSASLSATQVAPGTPITVTADVVNTGTVNGADSIKVYVNGELESSQGVTVNSGSSTPVTFTISRNEPGTYSVYVGGTQAGSFTVDQFADPNIILYISGALLVFAFIIGALFIMRRRQLQ